MPEYALFEGLTTEQHHVVRSLLSRRSVEAGDVVIQEGDPGDALYLVEEGELEVYKESEGSEDLRLTTLGPGDEFGSVALLSDEPRSASVRALTPTTLLALAIGDLRELSHEAIDSPYVVLLKNLLLNQNANLRRSSETVVAHYEAKLKEAQRGLAMGSFLGFLILTMCVYGFALRVSVEAVSAAGDSTPITVVILLFYVASLLVFMRRSGYSMSTFGLTLKGWKRATGESLLWSVGFIAVTISAKALAIAVIPAYQGEPLFSLDGFYEFSATENLALAATYAAFAPAQELIARGALQSSFQEFLQGKWVTGRAIVYSTMLFATTHLHLSTTFAIATLVPSVFWGVLYARQRTLVGVSISHVLIGLFVLFVLGAPGGG
jgi:hypothetical protein